MKLQGVALILTYAVSLITANTASSVEARSVLEELANIENRAAAPNDVVGTAADAVDRKLRHVRELNGRGESDQRLAMLKLKREPGWSESDTLSAIEKLRKRHGKMGKYTA
jgi:hypothetical protein